MMGWGKEGHENMNNGVNNRRDIKNNLRKIFIKLANGVSRGICCNINVTL
jgi:hypothetical protein